jgi:hypothetical protein
MGSFVTIATFTHSHELAVLKLLLEQEGLRFYFQNETIAGLVPLLDGIELKVHTEEVLEAKKILQELEGRGKLRKV